MEKDEVKEDDTSVRVALRIRPQMAREKIDMCQICTSVIPSENQVLMGKDKAFTFDYVFDMPTPQDIIYGDCVKVLIEGCFEGYNATVFAYGQTGSGKTYTMGTGFDVNISEDEIGIIPRAVDHLFQGIEERKRLAQERNEPPPDFKVNAQFMELYNEEILDLFDTTRDPESRGKKSHIKIHEDAGGGIYVVGVTTRPVSSLQDTMQCLKLGALSRATASTNMNAQSSRSHAIFTLHVKQQRVIRDDNLEEQDKESDSTEGLNEFETLTAKFHFVDLAGSERLKRTGATGDRAKEGISINCGLLALGNVISALGDVTKKGSHVPYRDSKLTRLLQDSLGGNSRTLMIACISPSDRDFMETLNTLKYANRARNIKNKVIANQDKASKQLAALRSEITRLHEELLEFKTGKRAVDADGVESVNDMFQENTMLQNENEKLRQRLKAMNDTIDSLTNRNTQLIAEKALISVGNISEDAKGDEVSKLIQGYVKEIEELRAKLAESDAMIDVIKRRNMSSSRLGTSMMSPLHSPAPPMTSMSSSLNLDFPLSPDNTLSSIIEEAKKDVKRLKKTKKIKSRLNQSSDKENISDDEKDQNEADIINQNVVKEDVIEEKDGKGDIEHDEGMAEEDDSEMVEEDDEDEDEEEELEDIEEDSSESEDKDSDNIHEDLAELTCEISIKQKLIDELEQSTQKLNAMKQHYEEKVSQLQNRIKATEQERDAVLSNINHVESESGDKVKKVKKEYEKKLQDLQMDLKKMQAAKKEHAKLLKNQSHYEKQLKTLQHELGEMKKTKVRLMKQVKEESEKSKMSEARRNKEVAQFRKEQLRKENVIRTLEKEKKQKEMVLRRKQEEVETLRRRQKPMSSRAAGRVGKYDRPSTIPIVNPNSPACNNSVNVSITKPAGADNVSVTKPAADKNNTGRNVTVKNQKSPIPTYLRRRRRTDFSAKAAKNKWDAIEKNVSAVVTKKQTISHLEKDMDVWIKQREKLCKKKDKYIRRKENAVKTGKDDTDIKNISDYIEIIDNQLLYAQENINECQVNIMQMEETKDEAEDIDISVVVSKCNLEEARYLLEKFIQHTITKGLALAQKDSEIKDLNAHLHQTELNNTLQQDLLKHMIHDRVDIEVDNLMTNALEENDSSTSSSSSSPADSMFESQIPPLPGSMSAGNMTLTEQMRKDKARRKTATPEELLYAGSSPTDAAPSQLQTVAETPEEESKPTPGHQATVKHTQVIVRQDLVVSKFEPPKQEPHSNVNGNVDSLLMPPPRSFPPKMPSSSSLPRVSSAGRMDPGPSPVLRRKEFPKPSPEPSPVLRRKNSYSMLSRSSSVDTTTSSDTTPPSSPTSTRRARVVDDNVFSRLTNNTQPPSINPPNRGTIVPNISKLPVGVKSMPVTCTHTAEGHSKAVLSVDATEELLFTSSKDRTAKVWDLHTGKEIISLSGHPNNVISVKYCPTSRLVFTVSQSYINVWDIRNRTSSQCVKTLSSSGLTHDGPISFAPSRQIELPPGEHHINDIALNKDGTVMYSATGSVVRVWDLKSFSAIGKLNGGHQSAVMVLAVDRENDNDIVVTGSKDHYIKLFEVLEERAGILTPKYNLAPPHYDGIQSLAIQGSTLFSGSRDTCIKKWDLSTQKLKQSVNSAHKDWICALDFMPSSNILLSGCRAGYLKLWNTDNCQSMGDVRAHASPINDIATNSTSIFTASNEPAVKVWQLRRIQTLTTLWESGSSKQIMTEPTQPKMLERKSNNKVPISNWTVKKYRF